MKNRSRGVVSIDFFQGFLYAFLYNVDCAEGSTQNDFFPTKMVSATRVCKFKAPPKEMSLSFSIGAFLTNYDVTNRKQQKALIYSIGGKTTFLRAETSQGRLLVLFGKKQGTYLEAKNNLLKSVMGFVVCTVGCQGASQLEGSLLGIPPRV